MLALSAQVARQSLSMAGIIPAMQRTYAALSSGRAEVPLRSRVQVPPRQAVSLFIPVSVQDELGDSLAARLALINAHHLSRGARCVVKKSILPRRVYASTNHS